MVASGHSAASKAAASRSNWSFTGANTPATAMALMPRARKGHGGCPLRGSERRRSGAYSAATGGGRDAGRRTRKHNGINATHTHADR
jgi:hypothetical protein